MSKVRMVMASGAGLVLSCALMAACGSTRAGLTRPASHAKTATASSARPVSSGTIYDRQLVNARVAATPAGVFVAWQVLLLGSSEVDELARFDPATGRIQADRRLGGAFGQAMPAAGWLWVRTTAASGAVAILRLDPRTLALTGEVALPGPPPPSGQAQDTLAVAGGGLWVASGGELVRLSLPGGTVAATVGLPGASWSTVTADSAGTVLAVGEANDGGAGAVQLRDPRTGALLRTSAPMAGVVAPAVGGVINSGVWVSEATGMMGYVERLTVPGLRAERLAAPRADFAGNDHTRIEGTNAIAVRVANGSVWITDRLSGTDRHYCGDPASGAIRTPIPLPHPDQDFVLAIGPRHIYYAAPGSGAGQYVRQEAIPGGPGGNLGTCED
jgi:hypothetical protein